MLADSLLRLYLKGNPHPRWRHKQSELPIWCFFFLYRVFYSAHGSSGTSTEDSKNAVPKQLTHSRFFSVSCSPFHCLISCIIKQIAASSSVWSFYCIKAFLFCRPREPFCRREDPQRATGQNCFHKGTKTTPEPGIFLTFCSVCIKMTIRVYICVGRSENHASNPSSHDALSVYLQKQRTNDSNTSPRLSLLPSVHSICLCNQGRRGHKYLQKVAAALTLLSPAPMSLSDSNY